MTVFGHLINRLKGVHELAVKHPRLLIRCLERLDDAVSNEGLKDNIKSHVMQVLCNPDPQRRHQRPLEMMTSLLLSSPEINEVVAVHVARIWFCLGHLATDKSELPADEDLVKVVNRQDLVAEYIGHSAGKTQVVLEQSRGKILFINEAHTVYTGERDSIGQEVLYTLNRFLYHSGGKCQRVVPSFVYLPPRDP